MYTRIRFGASSKTPKIGHVGTMGHDMANEATNLSKVARPLGLDRNLKFRMYDQLLKMIGNRLGTVTKRGI